MKKLTIYFIALFLVPAIIFTSCKPSVEPQPDSAFKILTDYMKENNLDLPSIIKYHDETDIKFVTAPPADNDAVAEFVAKYTIFDIRSAADFALGHIEGAKNILFENILTEAEAAPVDKPILMVCYTGQTACFATALLRLKGFRKTQALKWGMSGWNSTFDKWTANVGNDADGNANWTTDVTALKTFSDPELTETITDGKALLDSRIATVVAEGFKGVTASDVLTAPENYFINNYFSAADHTSYGHIKGAYRINPLTLADEEYKNIDGDKNTKVVTYCYTGQTSAVITAYLRVLGYNAYSLKFGMNGLWNQNPGWGNKNQWGVSANPKELNYVTGK